MIVFFDYADNKRRKEIKVKADDKKAAINKIQYKLKEYGIKSIEKDGKITIFDTITGPIAKMKIKGVHNEKAD